LTIPTGRDAVTAAEINAMNASFYKADDRVIFQCAATGVKAFEFQAKPHPRIGFYVVHPRNGTRRYEDEKSAVRAAKGFVRRWDNEPAYWERKYRDAC